MMLTRWFTIKVQVVPPPLHDANKLVYQSPKYKYPPPPQYDANMMVYQSPKYKYIVVVIFCIRSCTSFFFFFSVFTRFESATVNLQLTSAQEYILNVCKLYALMVAKMPLCVCIWQGRGRVYADL